MTDISFSLEAKSDQLNAMDIADCDRVIRVREVKVKKNDEQPVWVYFDGDNGRPWKPSKGMRRVLAAAWGTDSSAWIGRSAQLFMNPSVRYAGKVVGGIQIRGLSDIDKAMNFMLAINRGQRVPFPVQKIELVSSEYPAENFKKAFPVMVEKMESGAMTLQQVIAQCQKRGQLTQQQLAALEAAAPEDLDDDTIEGDDFDDEEVI